MKKPARGGRCDWGEEGLWSGAVTDMKFYTIAAICFGGGLGNWLFWRYRHWKFNRAEISLVPDGRGGFHDSLIRKERMFWWGYGVCIALFMTFGIAAFNGYI